MTLDACNKLLSTNPLIAILYLECLQNEFEANMSDVRLLLSSLPADFPEEDIIALYNLADSIKQNPNHSNAENFLEELQSYKNLQDLSIDKAKLDFKPEFNHNINNLLKKKASIIIKPQDERSNFFSQYAGALFLQEKISLQKEVYLNEFQKADQKLTDANKLKEQKAQQDLNSFVNSKQNSHDNIVERNASESFRNLKKSYPHCNVSQNIQEVKTYLDSLTDKEITKKVKNDASNLLREMQRNSNYNDPKERLAYVWQALKDQSKLIGPKAKGISPVTLQKNLKETLIQQLASAETNYSVERESYAGAGRSCPGGTKNIILQILDDYHADVNFGYL